MFIIILNELTRKLHSGHKWTVPSEDKIVEKPLDSGKMFTITWITLLSSGTSVHGIARDGKYSKFYE